MQVPSWLACLWPGLPRLWWRGDWRALVTAIGFAIVVNLWFVARFLWPELLPTKVVTIGGVASLGFWVASVWLGWRSLGEILAMTNDRAPEDLFIQAQQEYLRRHWFEAEHLLVELVRKYPRDVDAQLLLATLYRHTDRFADARERLEALTNMDGSERWQMELAAERQLLQRVIDDPGAARTGTDSEEISGEQQESREPGDVRPAADACALAGSIGRSGD